MRQNDSFEALSRICLNNWHYIDQKILSFHEGINFFTGHSGSGKSTVIDAMQILLYANTDGRAFFNKAAADDSDRTLMEYLRGMVNIGDNNEFTYLRNQNFSTTIVMELRRTDTGACQSIGVAFDVEPAVNEANRLFFWHKGPFLENGYRMGGRAMAIDEIRAWLQDHYAKEDYYFGPSNERFRKNLYDIYLGGLNMDRFPRLFKKAIPFRMDMKLEDFLKEYIFMEENIHISDMQESVMQYGRMRKRIQDTREEIEDLKKIQDVHRRFVKTEEDKRRFSYFADAMEVRYLNQQAQMLQDKETFYEEDYGKQSKHLKELEEEIACLEKNREELVGRIARSGYEDLQMQLEKEEELLGRLKQSAQSLHQTAEALLLWEEEEETPNEVLWDIARFEKGSITKEELNRLKSGLSAVREDIEGRKQDAKIELREKKKQEKELKAELKELRQGKKAYPKELEEAKLLLRRGLKEKTGEDVSVEILADLLEIKGEEWRNAVEGYMGNQKLLLVVEPAYAKAALEIYETLDKKTYSRVAVLDTDRVTRKEHPVMDGALAEEVDSRYTFVTSYIRFLLGNVIKCRSVEELRAVNIGVTKDCLLYHSFRLQYMNPENYTRKAYIGEVSTKKRIRRLEERESLLQQEMVPLEEQIKALDQKLLLEALPYETNVYLTWMEDAALVSVRESQKEGLQKKLDALLKADVEGWERELDEVKQAWEAKKKTRDRLIASLTKTEQMIGQTKQEYLDKAEELSRLETEIRVHAEWGREVDAYLADRKEPNLERLRANFLGRANRAQGEAEQVMEELRKARYDYLKKNPNRSFSFEGVENTEYDDLLSRLQFHDLEQLHKKADEQAREAVLMFKQDFIYKIRSAIREAIQRKDELNEIISSLDFGKDRYQFVVGKSKGPDGKYFNMFMDDDLEVNPAFLTDSMEHQMNLFTMAHENSYGDLMNELISMFIPPDHASAEEEEAARKNMEKYADYRTYLSFDMQQIIEGEETIKIRLSRMLRKNSGGEGQNPQYIALLASFAQAYKIGSQVRTGQNPTIRLVVLDEAFSKMDAEKVASCIKLIRGLGFQAIISATNDKIQNYLENVDKTFVYANPNKKCISIQEFEKKEFGVLRMEE